MEMGIDPARRFPADSGGRLQGGKPSLFNPARRAEMVEQRALPGGTDTRNLVEFAPGERLRASGAMGGYGKAMRLVAPSL